MNRRIALTIGCVFWLALACNLSSAAERAGAPSAAAPTETAPIDTPTNTPAATPTPEASPTATREYPYTIVEETRFEGEKTYTCDAGGCWREDGTVASKKGYFYPDIDAESAEIRALTDSLGLPADIAADDVERWRRIRTVWSWMRRNALFPGAAGYEEQFNAMVELMNTPAEHWPSIGEMARLFARFGKLVVGACNSKAFTFATLLYRAGVRPDSITVVHTRAVTGNHLYLAARLEGRWWYVDPTCIPEHADLAPKPESVGCIGADYAHPYDMIPLPGSTLPGPMLLE